MLPTLVSHQGFRARLVADEAQFAALAAQESHCSSARRGGDLGEFGCVSWRCGGLWLRGSLTRDVRR
jgi:hypothetical protein